MRSHKSAQVEPLNANQRSAIDHASLASHGTAAETSLAANRPYVSSYSNTALLRGMPEVPASLTLEYLTTEVAIY